MVLVKKNRNKSVRMLNESLKQTFKNFKILNASNLQWKKQQKVILFLKKIKDLVLLETEANYYWKKTIHMSFKQIFQLLCG